MNGIILALYLIFLNNGWIIDEISPEVKIVKHIKLAAVAAALIIWTGWQNNTVGITHYTVLSDSLPAAFDQYKIAVVSDLHNGEYGENNCRLTSIIKKKVRI